MQFDRKKISQENKTMKIAYSIKMRFTACYNKVAISKKIRDGAGIIKNGKTSTPVVLVTNVAVFVECWW